jgi:hypothetical protein
VLAPAGRAKGAGAETRDAFARPVPLSANACFLEPAKAIVRLRGSDSGIALGARMLSIGTVRLDVGQPSSALAVRLALQRHDSWITCHCCGVLTDMHQAIRDACSHCCVAHAFAILARTKSSGVESGICFVIAGIGSCTNRFSPFFPH